MKITIRARPRKKSILRSRSLLARMSLRKAHDKRPPEMGRSASIMVDLWKRLGRPVPQKPEVLSSSYHVQRRQGGNVTGPVNGEANRVPIRLSRAKNN